MKKFKFRLESVLQLKVRFEELCLQKLGAAEQLREKAQNELAVCRGRIAETLRFYREQLQNRFDPRISESYYSYLNWLNLEREKAVLLLAQREAEVAEARQRLLEASRERRVVEKLKEKAYRDYRAEELRDEINFLDELGTGRFVRTVGFNQMQEVRE
ncbi:flagellar FliJ protein [Hydrogenispora ethanolica]|jgi:flagellar FliJ protein|uniref:Flagellar FliJ protein n=1 Tax=Hydrogenispora ethanolica TaxID=1082276 RepID=A0A4R1RK39_HYDET|nr:flagellar export protein FliJ [Hydrogenispora ethanolica]TCL66543.1 flagellar FliJ protein [Hydrogenispora ethanolica]